jgi:hypothetical protein
MHARLRSLVPLMFAFALGCGTASPPAAPARPSAPVAGSHGHDQGHHGHDEPVSFADGVAKLRSLAAELSETLAENASGAADDAVHEIGHLLEHVRELATKEGLAEAATKGLDELEECFGKVDEAFHSGEKDADPKGVFESVKERLESALTSLAEVK